MTDKKYCYSHNEETYYGDFTSREEAIAEATADGETAWTAEQKPAVEYLRAREAHIGEEIEERLDEWLGDEIGWDDAIVKLTPEKRTELGKLVLDYLESNSAFQCFGVTNVQKHAAIQSTKPDTEQASVPAQQEGE